MSARVAKLLSRMTLEEKAGQLNQLSGRMAVTGPLTGKPEHMDQIRKGLVGSFLNILTAARTRELQKVAVEESRLGIPLLFAFDTIHGYKTIFPIPLAEASSWDLAAMEKAARVAAVETSAAGVHWTFAPMVDVGRDPRWGRVMEGAGEDAFLGAAVARARVQGFQGEDLARPDTVLACAKHFAAYGAVEAGREYNTVDVSERALREFYLPPFLATIDAGVATFMASFNEIAGVPSSANRVLMRNILREQWGFDGLVVSDWGSVRELEAHGVAADLKDAARLGLWAGVDMDMESHAYRAHLPELVKTGVLSEALLDESVARVLTLKERLGLLDDPYRYSDEARESGMTMTPEHLATARDVARRSIVLLANQAQVLPLAAKPGRVLLVGPLGDSKLDMLGNWSGKGEPEQAVTLLEGLRARLGDGVRYVKGVDVEGNDESGIATAVQAARRADVVVAALGESARMSGEARSRTNIELPGRQEALLRALVAAGKPVVLVLMNGRPLTIPWAAENVPSILETWFLGTQAGHAIADVLFGDYNPSGKLTMSFPRTLGQVPVYYNQKNTGRPITEKEREWVSRFLDAPNEPLYPFGHGLSYTSFAYGDLQVSPARAGADETIKVSFTLTNTGSKSGEEVAQLYVRDVVASVSRPVKELKGFAKVALQPGQSERVELTVAHKDLALWNQEGRFVVEPGAFELMVGGSSAGIQLRGGFTVAR